jgi:hypothetical protein
MPEWIHRRFLERQMERLELECSFPNRHGYNNEFDVWERRDGKILLLGYLVHDDDCSNPLQDTDGMGKIECKELQSNFMHHLGRDADGEPDTSEAAAILARLKGEDLDGFVCNTETLIDMWEEMRVQGKIGTLYSVALVYYEHEGYREWQDGRARGRRHSYMKIDAAWIPDKYLMEHLETFAPERRAEEAYKCFEISLDEYNKWATGDCWGVVVDIFERGPDGFYKLKENDACWGYVGDDYAKQELREALVGWRKHLHRKPTETPCKPTLPCPSSAPSQTA